MLSIRPSTPQKCTPNLLPARINHNGPINDASRYWTPETDEKGKKHAYFRGRHLHGTTLPLPENYTGAVLSVTDKQVPQVRVQAQEDGEEEEESIPVEVKIAGHVGTFDEMVVWGHGGEVDGSQDMFVRGVEEWVGFAESMHLEEDEEEEEEDVQESGKKA
jgi:ribonuclease H2 subunit C